MKERGSSHLARAGSQPRIWLLTAGACTAVIALAWWRYLNPTTPGGLFDYYPLYFGAQNLLVNGDAYSSAASPPGAGILSEVGNAYPLPATLLWGLPLAWLPPGAAGAAFTLVFGLLWVAAIRYARASMLWLLWWPMWDALRIEQPSVIITVAAITAFGALRRGNRWVFALCVVALALKPQQSLLVIAGLLWWGRSWWREVTAAFLCTAAVSFAVQPGWVPAWLEHVQLRSTILTDERWLGPMLLPLAALLWWRGWRVPALAVASTGLAPWPITGTYVASAWPLELDRTRTLAAGLTAAYAVLAIGLLDTGYWTLPLTLVVGLAIAAVALPVRRRQARREAP